MIQEANNSALCITGMKKALAEKVDILRALLVGLIQLNFVLPEITLQIAETKISIIDSLANFHCIALSCPFRIGLEMQDLIRQTGCSGIIYKKRFKVLIISVI